MSETVREVCAERIESFFVDDDVGGCRMIPEENVKSRIDRILSAYERDMAAKDEMTRIAVQSAQARFDEEIAAKDAEIKRLSKQSAFSALHKCPFPSYKCNGSCSSLMLEKIERQTAEIEKLRTALKPILACNEESCRAFGDHYIMLDDAVNEAKRIMNEGEKK